MIINIAKQQGRTKNLKVNIIVIFNVTGAFEKILCET
jgi:hypothetical protein